MLTLYYAPGSIALAALIALEETGLPFTLQKLSFAENQQRSPDYLQLNPKGRVPTLVTDQGALSETPAILIYLAALAPDRHLAPVEPFAFARLQSFLSYLASTVHVGHSMGRRGNRWSDDAAVVEALKVKVQANMTSFFTLIEQDLFISPYVLGDQFTVADIHLFAICRWLKDDGVDIAQFPKLSAFYASMGERPAVIRALANEQG